MTGQSKLSLVVASFSQFAAVNLINQATTLLAKPHFGGNAAETVHFLSKISSATAIVEFLVNPVVGKLSDVFGRKPFLLLGPVVTGIFHQLIGRDPSLRNIVIGRVITDVSVAIFVTALTASVADMYKDDETGFATASGQFDVAAGLSMVVGAYVGSRLTAQNPRKAYLVSSALAFACALLIVVGYKEHQKKPKAKSAALKLSDLNPLSFLWLFKKSPLMAKLNLINAIQQFPMYDGNVEQMFAETIRGWGPEQMGKYEALMGVGDMIAGILVGPTIRFLGARDHCAVSNAASLASEFTAGIATTDKRAYLSLLFYTLGSMRFAIVDSRITSVGNDLGVGQGKLAADRANLGAVVKTVAPLMYSWLYSKASGIADAKKGEENSEFVLGLPFFVNGALLTLSQLLILSLKRGDWVSI